MSVESRNFAQQEVAAKGRDLEADHEEETKGNDIVRKRDIFCDAQGDADFPDLEREDSLRTLPCDRLATLEEAIALLTRRDDIQGPGRRQRQLHMRQLNKFYRDTLTNYTAPCATELLSSNERLYEDHGAAMSHQEAAVSRLLLPEQAPEQKRVLQSIDEDDARNLTGQSVASVELVIVDPDLVSQGPVAVAWHLSREAGLNEDQMRPVVCIADAMEEAWRQERDRRDRKRSEGSLEPEPEWLIPLNKHFISVLIDGGGGCGKSRIIVRVLTPLFKAFFGPRGVVLTAHSNKAARLISGKTCYKVAKALPQQCTFLGLRVKDATDQRNLELLWVPAGALVKDEYSQLPAAVEHALCLRAAYGRALAYNFNLANYASPGHTHGDLPVKVTCGDKLQLPPVPESASLLATTEGRSREHRCGVSIFTDQTHVFHLETAFRFTGRDSQRAILALMRQPGGCTLNKQHWAELLATDVQHGASLVGIEKYTHCCYTWSSVCVGQAERSKISAKMARATLFVIPAEDVICDRSRREIRDLGLGKLALQHPNMNDMNRLPGFALLHEGMQVRFTLALHPTEIPPDTVGTVRWIDLHPDDCVSGGAEPAPPVQLLSHFPRSVAVKIHGCKTQFLPPKPCPTHAATGAIGISTRFRTPTWSVMCSCDLCS